MALARRRARRSSCSSTRKVMRIKSLSALLQQASIVDSVQAEVLAGLRAGGGQLDLEARRGQHVAEDGIRDAAAGDGGAGGGETPEHKHVGIVGARLQKFRGGL